VGTGVGLYGAFGGFKKAGGLVGLLGGGTPMNPLRPPYNLFSGPSSRVGVPQYQSGGPVGVNLGTTGGPSTSFNVPTTAPSPMDLNMIMEELRRRGSRRSAGGLAGLTVSSHKEGEQPSLGSLIAGYGPFGLPSLKDFYEYYRTPTGESDITSLGDPRYPWNEQVNPEMGYEDGKTWQERGGWKGFLGTGKDIVEGAGIVVDVDQARLDAAEEFERKRQEQLKEQEEEILASDAFGPTDEQGRSTMATVSPPESDPRLEIKFDKPVDDTKPPSDPDAPLTYMQQLQKLMTEQATSSSEAIAAAGTAEQKYLDYLKAQSGGNQGGFQALTELGLNLISETPKHQREGLGPIIGRAGKEPLKTLQTAQATDKALGFKIAEAEKDIAVRRAALKTAGLQQSFDNRITLIGAQTDAAAARLKLTEGMDKVTDSQVNRVGALVRSELGRIKTMEPPALNNLLQGLDIEGLSAGTFDKFEEIIGKRIQEGTKYRENDYVNHIALLAQEIYAKQGEDRNYEQAVIQATNDFIRENDILKRKGWFSSYELGKT